MPRCAAALLALMAVIGCNKEPETVPDVPIEVGSSSVPAQQGPNAFDAYARLAERAVRTSTVSLDARDTAGNRRKSTSEMGPLIEELAGATKLQCTFRFVPTGPFAPKPHQEGWLLLGRALVWRIEAAVEAGEWEPAARWTVVASVFGADLAGGGVSDATLGYGVLDGARQAIAPFLSALPVAALSELVEGTGTALGRIPNSATTIEHEGIEMSLALRSMQSALIEGNADAFSDGFYGKSREAFVALKSMDAVERNALFQALVSEKNRVIKALVELSSSPGSTRGSVDIALSGNEKVLATQFFTSGSGWLSVRDLTLARTRLLYCSAFLQLWVAQRGSAPADLSSILVDDRTDPFTGMSFGYLPLGRDFLVYSYGLDGKDDRGDTDGDRTDPDLLIEDAVR